MLGVVWRGVGVVGYGGNQGWTGVWSDWWVEYDQA